MARIGILTLYATGHLNPSLALARGLQAAGHKPILFNLLDTSQTAAAAGVPLVSYGEFEYPAGSLTTTMQRTAELSGPAAFAHYVQRMVLFFRAGFREQPDLLRRAARHCCTHRPSRGRRGSPAANAQCSIAPQCHRHSAARPQLPQSRPACRRLDQETAAHRGSRPSHRAGAPLSAAIAVAGRASTRCRS